MYSLKQAAMKREHPVLKWSPPEIPPHPCRLEPVEVWGDGRGILILGDNLKVVRELKSIAGSADLIYMDPPFATGRNFGFRSGGNASKAYGDRWDGGISGYLDMLGPRLTAMAEVLRPNGSMFVHLDWHAVHYVKVFLDGILGYESFVNEIIWHYYNKFSRGRRALPRAHDTILWYAAGPNYTFNEVRAEREKPVRQLKRVMVDGKLVNARNDEGNLIYQEVTDRKVDDVWTLPQLQPASSQWTGYPTQKHQVLLETIVLMASNEGHLVMDPFCGSGTTLEAAHIHGRTWAGIDSSPAAIGVSRSRMARAGAGFTLYSCDGQKFPKLDTAVQVIVKTEGENVVLHLEGPAEKELAGWCAGTLSDGILKPVWWSFGAKRSALSTSSSPISGSDRLAVRLYGHHGETRTVPLET